MPKHPGGRPTKLTDEIKKAALEYVEDCKDTIEHFEGDSGKHWETIRVKLPTVEGLARHLKVSRSTIYEWKSDKEFSDIIDDLLAEQADRLINMGLQGNYNPTIAKVLLTKHDYSDKVQQDITSDGKSLAPILVKFIGEDGRNTDTD